MLTVGQESSPLIKIKGGSAIRAVAFAANGEYLVSGGEDGVRVWRVKDGKQMATVEVRAVCKCLAVSKDGRWIAAGTDYGEVIVWDANTHEKVISHKVDDYHIYGVDFSPDSTRLVAASHMGTAPIWDVAVRKRVRTLHDNNMVTAAKYSPQGDRIATATPFYVRVWDSNDGRPLMDIRVTVTPLFNTGLLWFNNHLFIVSDSIIKQIEASTGSAVSEWPVPGSNCSSCIALPKHGKFIAYSTQRTVTFWDTVTNTQLGLIRHPQHIDSIIVSPDDYLLAIGGGWESIITIDSLSRITVSIFSRWIIVHMNSFLAPIIFPSDSISLSHIHPTFLEPDIRIDNATLHSW